MTIEYLSSRRIQGLSSDTKPTNVPNNTTFYETDTGNIYKISGGSWALSNSATGSGSAFTRENFDFLVYQTSTTSYFALNGSTGAVDFTGTDVGAIINSCINSIQPSTNPDAVDKQGAIYVAAGIYQQSTAIIVKNHITIAGSGVQSTIFEAAASTNIDGIRTLNFSSQTGTNNTKGIMDVTIRDLSLVGTDWQQTSGCGIKKYGFAWTIENVSLSHWKEQGIYTEWGVGGDSYSVFDVHSHVETWHNVSFLRNKAGGCLHRGPHDAYAYNCMFVGNTDYGLKTDYSASVYSGDIHLIGCHFWAGVGTNHKCIWVNGGPVQFSELYVETADSQAAGGMGIHAQGGTIRGSYLWVFGCDTGVKLEDAGPCTLDNVYIERNTVGIKVEGDNHRISGICFNNNNPGLTAGKNIILGASGLAVGNNYINLTLYGAKTAQFENAANNFDNTLHCNINVGSGETSLLNTVTLNLSSNVVQWVESGAGTQSGIGRPVNETNSTTLYNKTFNYPTINGRKGGDLARFGTYTATDTDEIIRCSGSFTVTLPTAVGRDGKWYTIIKVDSAASGPVTVATTSSQTIGGVLNYLLRAENRFITIESDGANWKLVGFVVPTAEGTFRKGTTPDRTYIAGLSPYSNTPLVTSTTGPTVNTLYAMPFLVTEVTKFDTIRCQVTTLGSSSNLRMGIYYDDGTMYPGKLYFDSGNVSAASTGVKPATITSNLQAFQPGLYWLTYENSATVPQIKALPGAGSVWYFAGADNTIANPGGFAWSVAHTVGALPDPYTSSATLITTASAVGTPVPAVGLRAVP